jgi:hypothetical protein
MICIIPARGGSKRLKNKNIYPLFGDPLLHWSIRECLKCPSISKIYVTSDNKQILNFAEQFGVSVIHRPIELSDDKTPKIDAIRHAVTYIENHESKKYDYVISVQANSPEINNYDIESGYNLITNKNLWEVFSVDNEFIMNGAFRIIKRDALFNKSLSAHCGVVRTDYIDVHTINDINEIIRKYGDRETLEGTKRVYNF